MTKQIVVTSCNDCPFCKDHYTDNMRIYTGTSCAHKENRDGEKIYLGSWEDTGKIHKRCPLDNNMALQWIAINQEDAPYGIPVWLWSAEWVNEDFNPEGIREGFYTEGEGYISCGWEPCQDVFTTEENSLPTMWARRIGPNI